MLVFGVLLAVSRFEDCVPFWYRSRNDSGEFEDGGRPHEGVCLEFVGTEVLLDVRVRRRLRSCDGGLNRHMAGC